MSPRVVLWSLCVLLVVLGAGCEPGGPGRTVEPPPHVRPVKKATLAVVTFDTLGNVRLRDAGRILGEKLLPGFAEHYELIDQMMLQRFLDEDGLRQADLMELAANRASRSVRSKAVKLRAVEFLVVGTISRLPSGRLSVTARVSDWQTGRIRDGGVGTIDGADWDEIMRRTPELAAQMTPASGSAAAASHEKPPPPNTISIRFTRPVGATLAFTHAPSAWRRAYRSDRRSFRVSAKGTTVHLHKGEYHFRLTLRGRDTLYGLLEVLLVNKDTMSAVFGVKHQLFKSSHLDRAWGGEPVLYSLGMEQNGSRGLRDVVVLRYRLGLRPMR